MPRRKPEFPNPLWARRALFEKDELMKIVVRFERGAHHRGIEWNMCDEHAKSILLKPCHYCGARDGTLKLSDGKQSILYSGIDRVDSKLGYQPGNVVPCCGKCNSLKSSLKIQDFIKKAHAIAAMFPILGKARETKWYSPE